MRLTIRNSDGTVSQPMNLDWSAALEKLATYEDAEEQGRLVPVVRCADCKWFQINMRQDGYLPKGVPECECRHWCGPCDPTDYCSYGEPPKEETE